MGEWQLSLSSKGDVFPGAVLGTGGSINVITRSGANVLHGDAFTDSNKYRSGLAIGGPIIRDKLFFYAAAEAVRRLSALDFCRD